MKKNTQELGSIDLQALAEVRGGTYPLSWVEQRFEPQPEPWNIGVVQQVGVIQVVR